MSKTCPECGVEIPAGSAAGLCPRCLLGLGISPPHDESGDRDASPASAVLTLPRGAIAQSPQKIGAGAGRDISSETESLLRGRLQVGCWIILLGLVAFLVRDLVSPVVVPEDAGAWLVRLVPRLALMTFYLAVIALLRGPRRVRLVNLRRLEVVILWAVALWFASDRLYWTRRALAERSAADATFTIAFSFFTYFAFLSAYGFFAPNTWRRALWMTGLVALLPIGVLAVIAARDPADIEFLRAAGGFGVQVSSLIMMLGIGVMIAAWGAHRIHALRLEVHEAKRLGQYRLTERIGRGGMGEVWKAEHRLLARPAAIKLISPRIGGADAALVTDEFARSFEREAQITAGLRSTHTVELYDFGITDDGIFYYVMELLDGHDLESLVRQHGPLDPARVASVLEQACDSLAEAHEQGLVHRDIKPANLQLCRLGRRFDFVKVLDFGLVKVRGQEVAPDRSQGGRLTIIGTPAYVAPEMAAGAEIDARADIYSLGCVGYWLLTGRHVFEGTASDEIIARHQAEAVVPPSDRVGSPIPAALERAVMWCLHKDPMGRPQSADELATVLRSSGLPSRWTQDDARAWWQEQGEGGDSAFASVAARSEP